MPTCATPSITTPVCSIARCGSTPCSPSAYPRSTPLWSPARARWRWCYGPGGRSRSGRWRWRCRSPGRSSTSRAGWRCRSPRFSRTSAKLSGGQRQRIAIARVILKDAPILVLDEATSALDSEVEAAIQSSLGTPMTGKTVIAIAHRLSTIARMARLIVLERGHIIEQGSHDELLRHGGHYAALWRRQSGGFLDVDVRSAERTAA